MRILTQSVTAMSVAAVLLSGCGGSQSPISAPGVMEQNYAKAPSPYRVLYSFTGSPSGAEPSANVIDVKGVLYGTTLFGGKPRTACAIGCGTVYSISTSGFEKVLSRFSRASGANPEAGLIGVGGTLYGTTEYGGMFHGGTVFSVSRSGKEHVLHSFGYNSSDGKNPRAGLIGVKGTLYGTTENGGTYGYGTVFSISTSGVEKVLHSFSGRSDGTFPLAGLVNVSGTLYGTTYGGGSGDCGSQSCGTVFSIGTSGTENILHTFGSGADGAVPEASLIEVNGTLYGTTYAGGAYVNFGTVFSITTSGVEKVLHSFGSGSDGKWPVASLIDVNGTLYGTTSQGGYGCGTYSGGCGMVFSISTSGTEKVLHTFSGKPDGASPVASLINVDGTLYGTTTSGGRHYDGTVFALTPKTR